MVKQFDKSKQRQRRHKRVRALISGTAQRPRLNVFRSAKHIYAQIIDDETGTTLCAAGSNEKDFGIAGGNIEAAKKVGTLIAQRAKDKDVQNVVFDRGGYLYHGRVQALADAARESGLEF